MPRQVINLGSVAGDRTGSKLRVAGQMVNDMTEELYALTSDTINAGAVEYDAPTIEQSIALANAACVSQGKSTLFIPASMLPYDITLCPASAGVRRTREGGDSSVYDVWAYGAAGDNVQDDTAMIQAAITAASVNLYTLQGGLVYFPPGVYKTTSGLTVPVALNQNQVVLRGAGMRICYLRPSGASANFTTPVVLFGAATPDASGTTTNNTQYCGLEHLSINGIDLTGSTAVVACQMTQMQRGWISHSIIEGFTIAGSIGLYLRGSTTTGVGAAAAPHTWRCSFYHVTCATTSRPLVLENADECDFHGCNFSLPTGLSSAVSAVDVIQGHNCRWFGGEVGGDTNVTYRPNYTGFRFRDPTKGDNLGHMGFGVVAEGFDIGIDIQGSAVHALRFYGYDSSINRAAWKNGSAATEDGAASGERGNNIEIQLRNTLSTKYLAGRSARGEQVAFPALSTTPSVTASDSYYCANGSATTIMSFLNGQNGQEISVRLDANTTIQHGTGANNIRCPGAANITAAAHKVCKFWFVAGVWYTLAVSAD